MLPPGFIGHLLFSFAKKHTKDSRHVCRNYFLYTGIAFVCVGFAAALLML